MYRVYRYTYKSINYPSFDLPLKKRRKHTQKRNKLIFAVDLKVSGMNPVNPAQDMNMIWMPAPTSIEGFYQAQQQLPSLDELTQQSALMVRVLFVPFIFHFLHEHTLAFDFDFIYVRLYHLKFGFFCFKNYLYFNLNWFPFFFCFLFSRSLYIKIHKLTYTHKKHIRTYDTHITTGESDPK